MLKVPKDIRVRRYELTIITPSGFTSDETKKLLDTITQVVEKTSAQVIEKQDWGKKDLSYTIISGGKRHTTGVYTHWIFECDSSRVNPIDRELALNHQVLRHLLVLADKGPKPGLEVADKASVEPESTATESK